MYLPSSFSEFLSNIRPTDAQLKDYQDGHRTLRERMRQDKEISGLRVADFLQGSYRRATAIRPHNDRKSDVDVVVATTIPECPDVDAVASVFEAFLDRYTDYKGKHERKTHSISLSLAEVEIDLVITSAPSEAVETILALESSRTLEVLNRPFDPADFLTPAVLDLGDARDSSSGEWKAEPLRVPNFDKDVADDERWSSTDPLTQIAWTVDKNAECNWHYVNVVKALKWWRRTKCPTPKHPKGYPVEHIIGDYCPAGIGSVAEGVVETLERIHRCPTLQACVVGGTTPFLKDRGIPEHNVWARVDPDDFTKFMAQVEAAAIIARDAYDLEDAKASGRRWHNLLGDPFPYDEDDGRSRISFSLATGSANPGPKRYG